MKLEIEIEGMSDLLARFKGVEAGMIDFRQLGAWKGVASEFRKVVARAFDSEGASGQSGKWKEVTPKYKERKLKKWGPVPILTASGHMRRSLTVAGSPDSVYEESAQELVIGTKDPKAGYHARGSGRLPKREPVSLTDDQKKQIVKPVQDKLKQLIANAKLRDLRGY